MACKHRKMLEEEHGGAITPGWPLFHGFPAPSPEQIQFRLSLHIWLSRVNINLFSLNFKYLT